MLSQCGPRVVHRSALPRLSPQAAAACRGALSVARRSSGRRRCTVTTAQKNKPSDSRLGRPRGRDQRRTTGGPADAPSRRSSSCRAGTRSSRSGSRCRGAVAARGARRDREGPARRLGAVHGVEPPAAAEHPRVAGRRPGRGVGSGAVPLLPGRRSDPLARGGRGDLGEDHPSVIGRMSAPRLGFGWKEVAFSGRSPPDSTSARTCSKSGLGSRTAGDDVLRGREGVLDVVVVLDPRQPRSGSRGRTRSCSQDTAASRSRSTGLDGVPRRRRR